MARYKRKYGLSIDWDYFVPTSPKYDFQMAENRTTEMLDALLWQQRYIGAMAQNVDLTKQIYMKYDAHKFIDEFMIAGFGFVKNASICFNDSHVMAYSFFKRLGVTDIINIDSHHDVFYPYADKGLNCGNWIGHLIDEKIVKNVIQFYPDDEMAAWDNMESVKNRKNWRYFIGHENLIDNLQNQLPKDCRFEGCFISKSNGWTPSWEDEKFNDFARKWIEFFGRKNVYGDVSVFNVRKFVSIEENPNVLKTVNEIKQFNAQLEQKIKDRKTEVVYENPK